jgi:hypothetical protein
MNLAQEIDESNPQPAKLIEHEALIRYRRHTNGIVQLPVERCRRDALDRRQSPGPKTCADLARGQRARLLPHLRRHASEPSRAEVMDGRFDFLPRIHDEGSMSHDGLIDGFTAQKE